MTAQTRNFDTWQKRFVDGVPSRGIPPAHIDDLPNAADKVEFWARRQGAEAISLFHDSTDDVDYVHLVVPSNDWTYGPFDDRDAAHDKLHALKDERRDD